MRNRLFRYVAASMVAGLVLTACGGDDEPDTPDPGTETPDDPAEEPEEPDEDPGDDPGEGEATGEGRPYDVSNVQFDELSFTFEAERTTQLINLMSAKERTWEGIWGDNISYTTTEEAVGALVSGAAWVVQQEPTVIWPALDQGVIDGVIIGVFNDTDSWNLFTAEGFDTPESLIGSRFSGGTIGESWNTVAEIIMRDEFGIDPAEVEFVSLGGGSDARVEAMLAGQIDGFMGQPRHRPLVEEGNGNVLFSETIDMAQGMFMTTREIWENNYDDVCAFLGGLFEANQWISTSTEPEWRDRIPEVEQYLQDNGYDTSEAGLDVARTWDTSQADEFNWALDLGAPAEAWDRQLEILSREGGEVSPDFDWRDHVDFSCIWHLQEEAGLPLNPDPNEM